MPEKARKVAEKAKVAERQERCPKKIAPRPSSDLQKQRSEAPATFTGGKMPQSRRGATSARSPWTFAGLPVVRSPAKSDELLVGLPGNCH